MTALRRILDEAPCSIRALAAEAGVSDELLRQIRDGGRRLTPATREALRAALQRWSATCADLADLLEDPPTGGTRE